MSNQKGFTLTEILVYTTLIGIVGSLFGGILITVTKIQQQQGSVGEVNQQLQFVMSAMQRLISSASVIDAEAGTPVSTLTLRMQDPAKDPTVITVTDQTITLREGTNEPVPLTTESVLVEKLFFTRLSSYPGHDSVQIDLAISANTQNPSEQLTKSLSSAVARVSAATFDADLIPGADGQFDVGLPSNRWQDLYLSGKLIMQDEPLTFGSLVSDPSGVQEGTVYYNTTDNQLKVYQNGDWQKIGNWRVSGNDIYNANSGNVGIGTDSPSQKLHVLGSATFSNDVGIGVTNPSSKLTVAGTIESTSGGFKFPDGTAQTTAATGGGGGGEGGTYYNFWATSTTDVNNIHNTNSGNVGINTVNPTARFDVVGSTQPILDVTTTGGPGDNTNPIFRVFGDLPKGIPILSTYRSGNVGIGTANPTYKLTVAGNLQATDIYTGDGVQIQGVSGRNYFRDVEGAGNLRVGAAWGMPGIFAESGPVVVGGSSGVSLQNNSVFVNTSGLTGFRTTSPTAVADIYGSAGEGGGGVLNVTAYGGGGPVFAIFKDTPKVLANRILTVQRDGTVYIDGVLRGGSYGFGGMYSVSDVGSGNAKVNPITGAQNCPSGYNASEIMRARSAEPEAGITLYLCWR